MKAFKVLVPVVAALLAAGQVAAQDDVGEDDVQRRLAAAEAALAEAAQQIAELTTERLPGMHRIERRIEIVNDGRPRLGVTIGEEEDGAVKGSRILAVTPGSAASEAGLRAGDIITAINGEPLEADSERAASSRLVDFMQGVEPGDTLSLDYLRDGKSGQVELEPRPVDARFSALGRGPIAIPDMPGLQAIPRIAGDMKNHFVLNWTSVGWGDMELVELSEGLGRYFGTDEGLLVVRAPASSVLQLEDGDVIQSIDGRKPTSVRHAMRILGSYQPGEKLTLEVMRDQERRTLAIEIPEDLSSQLMPGKPPAARPAAAPRPARRPALLEKT